MVRGAGFDSWFARCLTGPNVGLVAREAVSNKVVGVVNLNEIVAGAFQSAHLGYYGMTSFRRQGLMTEALRAAVSHAFGDLELHRLEANIQPENVASIALVRRLGFQKEGFSPSICALTVNGEITRDGRCLPTRLARRVQRRLIADVRPTMIAVPVRFRLDLGRWGEWAIRQQWVVSER